MPKAANPSEGGATTLETFDWAYTGFRGTPEEAGYVALEEPAAETDNDWNHAVREDLKLLNWEVGENEDSIAALDTRLTTAESDIATLQSDFGSHVHDSRYYTQTQSEDRYVNTAGDTMTGNLYTTGRLSVNSTTDIGQFYVGADSGIDAASAVIDSDGDPAQNDDALLVRGNTDPALITDSDSVLSVKGHGSVGVNTYTPSAELDVVGDTELNGAVSVGGDIDMNGSAIRGVSDTIEFASANGTGLDFRPNSDGDHYLWRHTDGAATPTEYGAQLSPGFGTVWRIRNVTAGLDLLSVGTDGAVSVNQGPLDASSADWLTLPTYSGSDPDPPDDGMVHIWARGDLS